MITNVLVADPNPGFAGMLQQVLEETGRFKATVVGSGGEAISAASRHPFHLAIIDSSLDDADLRTVIAGLRSQKPALAIMVILGFGQESLDDAGLDVQGTLSKPFYIPDLEPQIEEALTRPVNGVAPPPRPKAAPPPAPRPAAEPARASARPQYGRTAVRPNAAARPNPAPARQPAPPAPSWLNDVSRAAQYLTTLTLQSAAEAALLMRGQQLIAYAGQFGREQAEELSRVVADAWAKDGGGGSGAQVRFIRLSTGADFLVYSTLAAADIVLSMAFQAETPLGMIRKQAKQATEAIFRAPAIGNAPAALVDTFTSEPPPPEPARAASPEDWAPLAARPAAPSDAAPLAPTPAAPPPPSPVAPTAPSPHPLLGMPAAFPNARRTPHGLYALSYTYLIIPKFASTRLSGDLKSRLAEWISFQALTHDWRITGLHIEPDHLEISIDCAPSEAPEKVIKALMQYTAEKAMAEFPRLAAEHAKRVNIFWAQGYYAVAPGRRLSADEIRAFIDYQRQEQNG